MRLVLFLNMGGATSYAECELFLKNMFNDKYILTIKNELLRSFLAFLITKMRVKAMWENYQKIGGKSPLNDITARLCANLNNEVKSETVNLQDDLSTNSQNSSKNLNTSQALKEEQKTNSQILNTKNAVNSSFKTPQHLDLQFDFINVYVPPFAKDVLAKYELSKEDELILFPLYPHHSQTTVLSALDCVKDAISKMKIQAKLRELDIFYTNELYNEMVIKDVLKANEDFKTGGKKTLIFSAHSLPVSTIRAGDLYQRHVEEHVRILKKSLDPHFDEILLAYQSKLGPIKWLEPAIAEVLSGLKNEALIYPLSFCIDCSETVFELELEYRKIAAKDYKLISCPNDSKDFANFIKAYVN